MHFTTVRNVLLTLTLATPLSAATIWTYSPETSKAASTVKGRNWHPDMLELRRTLNQAPNESSGGPAVVVSLPLPNGTLEDFRVRESSVFSPELAAQHPEIKTYTVESVHGHSLRGRVDLTPAGFHGAVFDNSGMFTIEPTASQDYTSSYMNEQSAKIVSCATKPPTTNLSLLEQASAQLQPAATAVIPTPFDKVRSYRLAVATTAEFTKKNGGTTDSATAAIATILNTTNATFERDMAIHFVLVKAIIYTDTAAQPFTDADSTQNLQANQTLMDSMVGDSGYDVAHVFNNGGSSGLGVAGLCQTGVKAAGVSILGTYTLQQFAVEQVAHEIGHQINANHTFNGNNGSGCKESTRVAAAAYEVGSGVTVMSYAGICPGADPQDLDTISNGFFHAFNVLEMNSYIRQSANSCGIPVPAAISNHLPQIVMPPASTIPAQTPFQLTALVTDSDAADQKNLTYTWDEMDLGTVTPPNNDDGKRSLFRVYAPIATASRTFPSLPFILNNQNNPPANFTNAAGRTLLTGESMPTTTRQMNFRLVARDNRTYNGNIAGGSSFSDQVVNVTSAAGPFVVSVPNTAVTWPAGTPELVTWSVAKTDVDPINEKTVRIKLSVDGGQTFPYILASNVPNTGSATVPVPAAIPSSQNARIMVAAEKSIFFDVSDVDFAITAASNIATAPLAAPGGAISAAGIQPSVAPGSVISIYGANLSSGTAGATAVPLPTSLGGDSVTVNGVPIPLFYVSPSQINGQVPYETAVGEAVVVVTTGGVATPGIAMNVSANAPGVLQFGAGRAVAINPNGSVNNTGVGAKAGATVVIYMTGEGAVNGTVVTGTASSSSPLLSTKATTTALVGGADATVSFSGLTPGGVGLMQVNLVIPAIAAGDYPLVITVGGVSSAALLLTVAP
jgi:uncharacterized protein (TIGR03437 family)